jgi:hypothetical protein
MIVPTLLALALAGASADGPPTPERLPPTDAPADASPDAPAPRRSHESHAGGRHALALGWHGTTFFSEAGSQYTFHSASLGYLGSFGRRGLFVHAVGLVPLQARQDGHVYATADYYRRRAGADLLLGWQWRWTAFRGVEAEAGPGLHGNLLWLPGKSGYRDFSALPLGMGGAAVLRWRSGARAFARPVILGAYGSAAYDLYDPLRSDDLAHGFAFRMGLVVGVEARP